MPAPIINEIKMKLIAKPFKLPFSSDIVFNPFNKRILRKLTFSKGR